MTEWQRLILLSHFSLSQTPILNHSMSPLDQKDKVLILSLVHIYIRWATIWSPSVFHYPSTHTFYCNQTALLTLVWTPQAYSGLSSDHTLYSVYKALYSLIQQVFTKSLLCAKMWDFIVTQRVRAAEKASGSSNTVWEGLWEWRAGFWGNSKPVLSR